MLLHEQTPCQTWVKLDKAQRHKLLKSFENFTQPSLETPKVDAKVFDGPAVVHLLLPKACRNFQDYADKVFIPYVLNQLQTAKEVDLVWDRYLPGSQKQHAREKHATKQTLSRQRVQSTALVPGNWLSFLDTEENKTELFDFLATTIEGTEVDKILVSTKNELVVNSSAVDLTDLKF